jgi:hypothetical protein
MLTEFLFRPRVSNGVCVGFGVDNFAGISRGMVVILFVVVVIGMFIQSIKRYPHSATSAALLTRVGENIRPVDPSI